MKVLVKKKPAEPMVTASAAKRICRQQVRITSSTGYFAVWSCSRTALNSGDSSTPKRMARPTIISRPLIRKGTRQPQLMKSSWSRDVARRKAISASSRPAGLPSWAKEA
ncbi:hypothetical protein D9M68_494990 [compost metagenome]